MPYFSWHGIDEQGNLCDGYTFARTQEELLVIIHAEQIRVVQYTHERFLFSGRYISLAQRIYIFKQLAILIESGVLITDAFLLVIKQLPKQSTYTCQVLFTILANIEIGMSCAQAFQLYQPIFGKLTIALIQVAEETGQLPTVLNLIGSYWQDSLQLRRQIRAALMVPSITIIGFFILLFLLMYYVVPTFATILQTSGKPLPTTTAWIVSISTSICNIRLVHIALTFIIAGTACVFITYHERMRYRLHALSLKIPLVGKITKLTISIGIAQALSILINGGVPLVVALYLAREVIHNQVIIRAWDLIIMAVEDGMPLSKAMNKYGTDYFTDDFITLVAIGEESEHLDVLLARAATLLKERLHIITNIITQLIQPLCMILLGGLVAFLIVAIYIPLFDISNIVTAW